MGSWELDLRSGETLWSDGIYRILGIPPSDAAQPFGTVLGYVHPDDRERMQRMLADAVERPEAVPEGGIEHMVRLIRTTARCARCAPWAGSSATSADPRAGWVRCRT